MRKLVVLLLAVALGLGLAGTEQWIGPSPCVHYNIPNPEPGIFPQVPELFMPAVDTFKYDDGTPASAWAWQKGGNGWGMKFISPSDNVTLAGALIHFYSGWPTPGGTKALVKVFADDGPGGSPGTQIWASSELTIVRGQWNYVPIGSPVVGSNFYIFYVQVDSYPICPGLSIDAFNNAASHRKWTYSSTDGFAEDARRGEWLIRAVLDWSPQNVNATAMYFASNMPPDTVPGINFYIRTMIKNLGNNPLPVGTPVRVRIAGPQGYTYEDTVNTTTVLNRGQTAQMNFTPAWVIPQTSGNYRITSWVEAAGEQWPADDTITYDLSVARWIEYANFNRLTWLTWGGRERATKFNPATFGLTYPVGLFRMRHQFYLHPSYPWPDSSFTVKVYAGDGSTLLYESDTVEAAPGTPGPIVAVDFDSTLIFNSGEFYISVRPVHTGGHPSSCADDTSNGRSFYGQPGAWTAWTMGEYFTSASCQGGVGVAEGVSPVHEPTLRITNYPNPVCGVATIKWQVPRFQAVSVNLYDATGRLVRNLYSTPRGLLGTVTLDAKQFASGIYLVRLETEDAAVTHKLILEH
ncbi:MAG: T9SS type A sorting domain-containing protein [candidate division WOR-3 bacterium]